MTIENQQKNRAMSAIGGFFSESVLYRRLVAKMANNHPYPEILWDLKGIGYSEHQIETAMAMIKLAGCWKD
jgi:hypothetical protein